ncbi:MAG: hypothetical protein HY958_08065 [Bacteroidia bacterium]|nr:hypothetical protein [Bacteroidia bacterium]
MSANNQSFSEDLDRLINLFKRLKDKLMNENRYNIDKSFIQNIDLMIQNYEMIKGNMPPEVLNSMGEPIHKLMLQLLDQMNMEYGDIIEKHDTMSETPVLKIDSPMEEIRLIDDMLKRGQLAPAEIDKLLDRRADLMTKELQKTDKSI